MKIIKRILKIYIIILIFNIIFSVGFLAHFSFSVLSPSLKSADVSLLDIIKSDITPEKEAALDDILREKAGRVGSNAANNVKNVILKLLPFVEYSEDEKKTYPTYTDYSEFMKDFNMKNEEAFEQGLDILKQMEN